MSPSLATTPTSTTRPDRHAAPELSERHYFRAVLEPARDPWRILVAVAGHDSEVLQRAQKLGLLVRPPQRPPLTRAELWSLGQPLRGASADVLAALADNKR